MPCLSHPLQQSPISSISLTKLPGALSWLQDGLEVVQHQQTTVIPHGGEKQRYLVVYLPWQIGMLLLRDKADALLQEDFRRRSILERAPEDILEILLHLHGYLCGNCGFPHPSHAQHCHNPAARTTYPVRQLGILYLAPIQVNDIGGFTPIFTLQRGRKGTRVRWGRTLSVALR